MSEKYGNPKLPTSEYSNIENSEYIETRSISEIMRDSIVSVSDLIPGMNSEGLDFSNNEQGLYYDSDKNNRSYKAYPGGFGTGFASQIYYTDKFIPEFAEKINTEIQNLFENEVVVDLGAGREGTGFLIADRAHAKAYVADEPNFKEQLIPVIAVLKNPSLINQIGNQGAVEPEHEVSKIPVAVVAEDMLTFLKRLPDNSVSIFCSGIDELVMDDNAIRNAIAKEIRRVLSPTGGYVGAGNGHIKLSEDSNIKVEFIGRKHDYRPDAGSIYVYKKQIKN